MLWIRYLLARCRSLGRRATCPATADHRPVRGCAEYLAPAESTELPPPAKRRQAAGDSADRFAARHRLVHNPAVHAVLPEVPRTERGGWGVAEAISFLAHLADADDRDAELFETLVGTGLRKGGGDRAALD